MSQLYSITFTPKRLMTIAGQPGAFSESYGEPVTMHALPYAAAMSYKAANAANFTIQPYQIDDRRQRSKGVRSSISYEKAAPKVSKKHSSGSNHSAAATGNLAAAINHGS